MTHEPLSMNSPSDQPHADSHVVRLIISWLWVGVPLAWGVWQTIIKSLPLFESLVPPQ